MNDELDESDVDRCLAMARAGHVMFHVEVMVLVREIERLRVAVTTAAGGFPVRARTSVFTGEILEG